MALNPDVMQASDGGSTIDFGNETPITPDVVTATATSPGYTATQLLVKTAEQVAAGVTSTSKEARLGNETSAQANARLTAAYREMIAKPIMTPEQIAAGGEVRYVRSGGAGRGEYRILMPFGSVVKGSALAWTMGIIPSYSRYVTGTTLGMWSNGDGTVTNVGQVPVTTLTKTGETSTRSFVGQDAYYEVKVGNTGKTQAQLDIQIEVDKALQLNKNIAALLGGTIDPKTGKVTNVDGKYVTSIVPNSDGTTTITASDGTKMTIQTPTADDAIEVDESPISGKVVSKQTKNPDGSITYTYTDGTSSTVMPKNNNLFPNNQNNNLGTGNKTVVSTYVDPATGRIIAKYSDGSSGFADQASGPTQTREYRDAFALLEQTFRDYGLESLVPAIKGFMARDLGPEQATVELRTTQEYIARFKGNQLRLAVGKNALREDIYLATERAYDETLTAYGQANYFGIDRLSKQAKMAEIIGNDISADEFKSRVDLAVARVYNADPTIKKLLKDFYPNINDADLVGYFLNPAEGLPKLTEKVTSAEIGSAFLGQGLAYTQQRSAELAQYGIDRAGALKGAAEVKEVLPQTQKFVDVYGEAGIDYTQQTAEEEFLKNNQDAATKRKRLASMERGSFGGSAGNAPGAYSTGYLKKSSAAGLI